MNKYIKELDIKNIHLKNNVFLAPMAGVTDIAFRKICRQFGPALTFTEMASTKAMEYESKKTDKLLEIMDDERPSVVQIFGSSEETIKNTIIKLNENDKIDIIDINMGCPAPKLVKNGDGAGLLLDLDNIKRIVNTAVKVSKKPITVKTRKGFDDNRITAVEVAKICEDAGVSMITVHGRTREEYYSGYADLDIIKQVKESVNIPVIGNGDIFDLESATRMFEYTGCDGIMVARGSQGNPWIFKSILEGVNYFPANEERYNMILEHMENMLQIDDEKQANLKMRKHIAWYLKGMPNSSEIRNEINTAENIEESKEILRRYFENL